MIETNKWSILLCGLGVFVMIISTIQWFFKYPDPSQFLTGFIIGLSMCGFAYIYDWMKLKDKKIENLEKRLDSLVYPKGKE